MYVYVDTLDFEDRLIWLSLIIYSFSRMVYRVCCLSVLIKIVREWVGNNWYWTVAVKFYF